MSMNNEVQLRKGVLEMCVLYTISKGSAHGYDVIKKMNEYFPEVSGSNIYAILRRLCDEKCVTMTHSDEGKGPTRKNYDITEKGMETLNGLIDSWRKIRRAVDDMGIIRQKLQK